MTGRVDLFRNQAHHHLVLDAVVGQGVDPPPARGLDLAGDVQVLEDDVASLILSASPLQVHFVHRWPQGERGIFVDCIQDLQFDLTHILTNVNIFILHQNCTKNCHKHHSDQYNVQDWSFGR